MPDTHINAYFADAEEKLLAVQRAQGEYQAALQRLNVKKQQVGWVDPQPETKPAEPETDQSKSDKKKK